MQYRTLGDSGLKVPALSLGTATFGGHGELFGNWGTSNVNEARHLIDIALEAGVNLFDTADVYSDGASEEILGAALKGRRHDVIISTKTSLPLGEGPMDAGSSRHRLIRALHASLKRLQTNYIDIFLLHAYDAQTPIEEVLHTLDGFVRQGKIRYVGVSNFSGWQLMKSLAIAEKYGYSKYVTHQVYYSLAGRDYEHELLPLAADQRIGAMVWSPLGWGRLTGKVRRGQPLPEKSRLHKTAIYGPPVDDEKLFAIIDALDQIAKETGKTIPQIAINWLLQRPTVSTVVIGARNEEQLRDNLHAADWTLTAEQVKRLAEVSKPRIPYPYYPYYIQEGFRRINPPLV